VERSEPIFQRIIAPNDFAKDRKPIIQRIQEKLDAKLIVYTASSFHPIAQIMIQDVCLFEDLLRSAAGAEKGYLMINSPGGDPDAAEKLLMMCRERFTKAFAVIVPDYAKSAATMMALGSDKILMGYLAELGPIDPQLRMAPAPFPGETIPARSFIDGLESVRKRVIQDGDPVQLYYPMMAQIRPEILARCQSAIEGSRAFAEKWLKKYMLKLDPRQAGLVAEWLSTGEKYKSHGKVIDFTEAKEVLKLNVEKIDPNSDLWADIWELYCRSVHFLHGRQREGAAKLFESESVSLTMNIQVTVRAAPRPSPLPQPQVPPTGPPSKAEEPEHKN